MISAKKVSCLSCPTTGCLINRNCHNDWKQKFDLEKSVNTYKKGEYIFREGFPIIGLYFICEGKVKVVSITENAKEHVVRFAKDGHILGHIGNNSDKYSVDSIAMEDSVICFLKNDFLKNFLKHNNDLLYDMMMYYSCELRKSEIGTRNIALMNVKERIAHSLILLVAAFGSSQESGVRRLNMKISGADIAKIAGTTPEEISRTFSDFKKQGILTVDKKSISILDWGKLEKMIEGYSHEWSCCERAF